VSIKTVFEVAPLVKPAEEQQSAMSWHAWLLVGLVTYILVSQAYNWMQGFTPFGFDFSELYTAGERLNHGAQLYADVDINGKTCQPYVLPPLLGILSRPLALLTFKQAITLWFAVMAGSLIGGVFVYAKSLSKKIDPILVCLMLITGFRTWPATMEFSLANCTFIIVLFVCCIYFATSANRFKSVALIIVAAALIKTWAIGLVGCLVVKRRWKEAAMCLGAWALSLVALFGIIGFKEFSGFLKMTSIFTGSVDQIKPAQSIIGFARLHFSHNKYANPLLDSQTVMLGFILVGAVLIASGLIYIYLHPAKSAFEDRLQVGIVITSMLLSMPFCDVEYLLICIPCLWTLLTPPTFLNKSASVFSRTAAIVLYLAAIRLTFSTTFADTKHPISGIASLIISDGYFWLTGLWLTLMLVAWQLNSNRLRTTDEAMKLDQPIVPASLAS
jgi:hypothetical protein